VAIPGVLAGRSVGTHALIDTIGTYPHGTWGRPTKDTNYNYRLFESFTQVDAAGTRLVIGQGARPELLVYNAEDSLRLERIVRWTTGDRAVTSQELQANRDRVTEQYKDLEPAARREAMEYELGKVRPVAEEFPAFGRLVIGRDGRFWVREFRRPSAPRPHQWIAFDSTGRFDCRATIPPFAELYEFGADYLLTLEQDSLDQEKVLQYSIGHAIETGR
jgi:hypothetical protein